MPGQLKTYNKKKEMIKKQSNDKVGMNPSNWKEMKYKKTGKTKARLTVTKVDPKERNKALKKK